jgi:hypothetical protein
MVKQVIIASVPWRIDNLLILVAEVLHQGFPIKLILDRYNLEQKLEIKKEVRSSPVSIYDSYDLPGHIVRWKHAQNCTTFAILDDDLMIEHDYLESGFSALTSIQGRVVSYAGWTKTGEYLTFDSAPDDFQSLEIAHCNSFFGFGADITEFWKSKFVNDADMLKIDDERFISAFYHSQGWNMLRPPGRAKVQEVLKYSKDPRRLYMRARTRLRKIQKDLGLAVGRREALKKYGDEKCVVQNPKYLP